jgi:diguanylate cyclase (GGDEF)-like protein
MQLIRLTVAQKIALGYLLVVGFCLAAIVYALLALSSLMGHSEQLVSVEFRTFTLSRDLSRSLLDQERLERQILVLRDASMLPLLESRQQEITSIWRQMVAIPHKDQFNLLQNAYVKFAKASHEVFLLLTKENWDAAEQQSLQTLSPGRDRLLRHIEQFRQRREGAIDETIRLYAGDIRQGYRLTLALAFAGISLAALVAVGVILKIHRAIGQLTTATQAIAAGNYDYPLTLDSHDEFGHLARHFADMAQKLRVLEELHLDANPLTRLPGNVSIKNELESRIAEGQPFAHIYVDLDYFKAYNDRYGYQAGSNVIALVGDMVKDIGTRYGTPQDLIGHIGGDDYVLLSTPDRAESIAVELIKAFDTLVPELYNEKDREIGYFKGLDRYGVERQFPLLSMSIAIVCSNNLSNPSGDAIGRECAKMKEHLKKLPGSNYLIDRRELR